MSRQSRENRKGLTVKDLVTIGIFTALLFITMLIGGIVFAPNPVLTFYQPLGSALLGGPVLMLLIARVPKRGSIAIPGILIGIVWFATGMHWAMDIGYILGGIQAAGSTKARFSMLLPISSFVWELPEATSAFLLTGRIGAVTCWRVVPPQAT